MRVLVTGADGQLGRSLVKVGGRHDLVCVDLPEGDITSAESMERLVAGVDVIVNCAAWTDVERAEDMEEAALRVNSWGAGVLAGLAARHGTALVHISTDYVFDGMGDTPLTEDAAPRPLSAYGRTKLAGERAVQASGCRAAIVRTSWLYSEYGNNFVKTMLRLGRDGRTELSVVADQWGCPTYATGLAEAVVVLIERGIEGCEFYHYCDAGATTWHAFAGEIFARAGIDITVRAVTTAEYGAKAPRPLYSVLDTTKIAPIAAPQPWRQRLSQCLEMIK